MPTQLRYAFANLQIEKVGSIPELLRIQIVFNMREREPIEGVIIRSSHNIPPTE